MRKHLLAIIATTTLCVSALSGCTLGNDSPTESPTAQPATKSARPTPAQTKTTKPAPTSSSPTATASEVPACEVDNNWNTNAKSNDGEPMYGDISSDSTTDMIYAIDTGSHDCFDRVVIRVDTDRNVGYNVEYVDTVYTPGKGDAVDLLGDASLRVWVRAWSADTDDLYQLDTKSPGWPVLREVVHAGAFEGETTIAVGVAHEAPFEVYYLPTDDGQMRIVIEIFHR